MKTRLGNGHASTPCKTTLVRGLLWGLPYSLFFREDEGDYSSKHLSRKKVCHIFSPKYTWLSFLAKFQLCIPFVALLKLLRRKGPAVAGMGYWITATVQGSSWVRVVLLREKATEGGLPWAAAGSQGLRMSHPQPATGLFGEAFAVGRLGEVVKMRWANGRLTSTPAAERSARRWDTWVVFETGCLK